MCCDLPSPEVYKDFIQDFYDFVAGIVLNTEHLLIIGDFNIHVCCDSRPLVKDFLNLIDSFNLTQSVTVPTQEKGHTLDLEWCENSVLDKYTPPISP